VRATPESGGEVGVKIVPPSRRASAAREVEALRALNGTSAFIPQYYGHVEAESGTSIAMQAGGRSLSSRLELDGSVPPAEALSIIRDVGEALSTAHDHGFTHGEVEASNVVSSKTHSGVLLVDWDHQRPFTIERAGRDHAQLLDLTIRLLHGDAVRYADGQLTRSADEAEPAPELVGLDAFMRGLVRGGAAETARVASSALELFNTHPYDDALAAELLEKSRLYELTPDASGDLTRAAHGWAAERLGLPVSSVQVERIDGGGMKGQTDAILWNVRDASGANRAVLKLFPDAASLTRELAALHRLEGLEDRGVAIPRVLGLSRAKRDGKTAGAAFFSVAPGVALDDVVQAFAKASPADRPRARAKAESALDRAAEALATVHTLEGTEPVADPALVREHAGVFRHLTAELSRHPVLAKLGLDPGTAEACARLADAFEANPGPGALVLGDASIGNLFVDAPGKPVTLIDLEQFRYGPPLPFPSLVERGAAEWADRPIAPAALDVAWTALSAERYGTLWGASPEEAAELARGLRRRYEELAGDLLTPQALAFYEVGAEFVLFFDILTRANGAALADRDEEQLSQAVARLNARWRDDAR
jgi:aminoglycoside phosphotransferase (APT) family kinase protein